MKAVATFTGRVAPSSTGLGATGLEPGMDVCVALLARKRRGGTMWPVLSLAAAEAWESFAGLSLSPGGIDELALRDDAVVSLRFSSDAARSVVTQLELVILPSAAVPAKKTVDLLQTYFSCGTLEPLDALEESPTRSHAAEEGPHALHTGNVSGVQQAAAPPSAAPAKAPRAAASKTAAGGSSVISSNKASVLEELASMTARGGGSASVAGDACLDGAGGDAAPGVPSKAGAHPDTARTAPAGASGYRHLHKTPFSGELLEAAEDIARILALASSCPSARGSVPYREWRVAQLGLLVDGFARSMAALSGLPYIVGWRGARFRPDGQREADREDADDARCGAQDNDDEVGARGEAAGATPLGAAPADAGSSDEHPAAGTAGAPAAVVTTHRASPVRPPPPAPTEEWRRPAADASFAPAQQQQPPPHQRGGSHHHHHPTPAYPAAAALAHHHEYRDDAASVGGAFAAAGGLTGSHAHALGGGHGPAYGGWAGGGSATASGGAVPLQALMAAAAAGFSGGGGAMAYYASAQQQQQQQQFQHLQQLHMQQQLHIQQQQQQRAFLANPPLPPTPPLPPAPPAVMSLGGPDAWAPANDWGTHSHTDVGTTQHYGLRSPQSLYASAPRRNGQSAGSAVRGGRGAAHVARR